MSRVKCGRCGKESSPPEFVPYSGALKEAILSQICGECWEEWKKRSVMVINEFRLTSFMPEHREVLEQQMKEFLSLKV